MEDYKDSLSKAKANVDKSQLDLLEIYLSKIREEYINFDQREREFIVEELESLVSGIETKFSNIFDPSKAQEIRKKVGLSGRALGEMVGISKQSLSVYERGQCTPHHGVNDKTRKYVEWLKEQGYNPFNI